MKYKAGFLVMVSLFFIWSGMASAMESANFKITSSVMSGGGGIMSSASFASLSVLGQPTPIMDQDQVPGSGSFDLYPGFIYTLVSGPFCLWDNEPDGDVDGLDLYNFIPGYNGGTWDGDDLIDFSHQFGRDDCF